MHSLDVTIFFVLTIDKDIIKIHNNKDIKLFYKDLVNIALEGCQSIGQSKKHYLILKMAVSSSESSFLLIFFANSHPVIGIGNVELGKSPGLS